MRILSEETLNKEENSVIRLIDGFVFWLLTLIALFLILMALTGEKIILSCLLAALCCIALHALWTRFSEPLRRRSRAMRREYARHLIDEWAALPEKDILSAVLPLLPCGDIAENLTVLPYAPSSRALNADALIACRRAHPQGRLAVIALCPADRSAALWAKRLSIALIDGKRLTELLMAAHPAVPDSFHIQKKRRISLPTYGVFTERINPLRSGLYAALTLALYIARGGWPMLLSFALLLVMTALGLRRRLSS